MGDRTKLPKWAQTEIENLERRLEASEARFDSIEAGETDVYWTSWRTGGEQVNHLPVGSRVVFGDEIEVYRDHHEDIRVATRGHGRLEVVPQASNCVSVRREVADTDRYRLMRDAFEDAGLWTDEVEDVIAADTGVPDHLRFSLGGRADKETEYQIRARKRSEAKESY